MTRGPMKNQRAAKAHRISKVMKGLASRNQALIREMNPAPRKLETNPTRNK